MGRIPTAGEELAIYALSVVVIVALTALYTAVGGIKAVIWTDFIQAGVLVAALAGTLSVLLSKIPGGWHGARALLTAPGDLTLFASGLVPGAGLWGNIVAVLGSEYTLFAAIIGSTFITLATHGTDQDAVQRMLTGKDAKESRRAVILSGLIDAPIVLAFLTIGILLWAFYQTIPTRTSRGRTPTSSPTSSSPSSPPGSAASSSPPSSPPRWAPSAPP